MRGKSMWQRLGILPAVFLMVAAVALAVAAAPASAQSSKSKKQASNLREQINRGTVGIISGGINGTYIRIASDLASVLDDGNQLRILPLIGKGAVQNIRDILYLKGIDIGIVQSDVLAFLKRQRPHAKIEDRIHYITKLYNEEFHLLAGKRVGSLKELSGKRVNIGEPGSGSTVTASIVFQTLGIQINPTNYDQALALEMLKSGKIDAMVSVAAKPTDLPRRWTPTRAKGARGRKIKDSA